MNFSADQLLFKPISHCRPYSAPGISYKSLITLIHWKIVITYTMITLNPFLFCFIFIIIRFQSMNALGIRQGHAAFSNLSENLNETFLFDLQMHADISSVPPKRIPVFVTINFVVCFCAEQMYIFAFSDSWMLSVESNQSNRPIYTLKNISEAKILNKKNWRSINEFQQCCRKIDDLCFFFCCFFF